MPARVFADLEEGRLDAIVLQCFEHHRGVFGPGTIVERQNDLIVAKETKTLCDLEEFVATTTSRREWRLPTARLRKGHQHFWMLVASLCNMISRHIPFRPNAAQMSSIKKREVTH